MAVATTGSAKTWPQSAKPRFEVRMIEPLSARRLTTWKIQWAEGWSSGR